MFFFPSKTATHKGKHGRQHHMAQACVGVGSNDQTTAMQEEWCLHGNQFSLLLNSELVLAWIGLEMVRRFPGLRHPPSLLTTCFSSPVWKDTWTLHLIQVIMRGQQSDIHRIAPYKPAAVTTSRTTVVSQVRAHTHPDHLDHLDMIPN